MRCYLVGWIGLYLLATAGGALHAGETVLFDFERPGDLGAWSNLELPPPQPREPAAKFELSTEHATSGEHSLKITFSGGRWPTLTTTRIPDDWDAWQTFHADVTVGRACLVGFSVLQEKSKRGGDWDGAVSRWTKTELVKPGVNHIAASLHPNSWSALRKGKLENGKDLGKVVRFEIFLYSPHDNESIYVDNIRLTTEKLPLPEVSKTAFRVLGTDLAVHDVQELGEKLIANWNKPKPRTVQEVEDDVQTIYQALKRRHKKAVLAILRDGEKGYDPRDPERIYAGWKDAFWTSHGPDGLIERANNHGRDEKQEIFMRHRSPLMRVDFSSIPSGSNILAARLLVVRSGELSKENNPEARPTMWAAEPCNRPWHEYEVKAYVFAKDRYWREIGGRYYGADPDFLPVYVAHGPGSGAINTWDFTEAVRFWHDGKHPNHGFMLHGDSYDYLTGYTRETKEIKNRPAVFVIYEPK